MDGNDVNVLLQALPYIRHHTGATFVVKCGGETGSSIRANGLQVICPGLLVSTPELLCHPGIATGSPFYLAIENIGFALQAILGAEDRVMVVFDVPADWIADLMEQLPAAVSPTVSETLDEEWRAGQVLVARHKFGEVLRLLKANGAREIAMQDVDGYLP